MSPESGPLKMSSTSEAFVFTKLKGTNYVMWADHMKSALQAKYLWLIVKGTETCPPAPPAKRPTTTTAAEYKAECKEHLDWLLRDEAAQGVMKSACESSQLPHVKDCTSAKDMWNTLKRIHVTNHARINAHYYFEELYTRKYIDGTPMADHITAILDLKSQIQDASEMLDNIHVACAMVLSLPKTQSWDIIKIQLFNIESAKLTTLMPSPPSFSPKQTAVCAKQWEAALHCTPGKRTLASVMASRIHSMHAEMEAIKATMRTNAHTVEKTSRREQMLHPNPLASQHTPSVTSAHAKLAKLTWPPP
jgi:hypothetical protein